MFQNFFDYCLYEKGLSKSTIATYQTASEVFQYYLDDNELEILEIKQPDISHFIYYLIQERQNSKSSVNNRLSFLGSLYKYLIIKGRISTNPMLGVQHLKTKRSLPKFLNIEDTVRFLDSFENPLYRAIVETLYSTGCRVSELVNMDITDIDWNRKQILVTGKGDKERIVLLTDRAIRYLRAFIDTKESRELALFVNSQGPRVNNRINRKMVYAFITRQADKLRLPVTPHVLRHCLGSHLTQNNTNPRVIQNLLGHVSLETTQKYAHVTGRYVREEYQAKIPEVLR